MQMSLVWMSAKLPLISDSCRLSPGNCLRVKIMSCIASIRCCRGLRLSLCLSHTQARLQEAWTWGISSPPTKATPGTASTGSAPREATWRKTRRTAPTLRTRSTPLRRPRCPRPKERTLSGCTLITSVFVCIGCWNILSCVQMFSLRPTTATLIDAFKGPRGDSELCSFWG